MLQPDEPWFQNILKLFWLKDFNMAVYGFIEHGLLFAFIERWQAEKLSFHLLIGEMIITLDDVSCLILLPIIDRLLDHSRITRPEALNLMVIQLWASPGKTQGEIEDIEGCHVRLSFLLENYIYHPNMVAGAAVYDAQVSYHKVCALRTHFMIFVGTYIFCVQKSVTNTNILYIKYFMELERIFEYN